MDKNPERITSPLTRRNALTAAGLGAVAMAGLAGRAQAAGMTAIEKANVDVVNAFCAAWPSHDVDKIMSFFADPCSYRMTETREPIKGHEAVAGAIKGIIDRIDHFEVLDTYAKGSMVVNERIDSFVGGKMKAWHGVGVFFLKDGKIVEWSDYGIPSV